MSSTSFNNSALRPTVELNFMVNGASVSKSNLSSGITFINSLPDLVTNIFLLIEKNAPFSTSRYIRDAPPEHLQNYVRYISTREGVEKADESKKNLPATSAQKDLIRQLLKDMPESRDMLEYEDYHQRGASRM